MIALMPSLPYSAEAGPSVEELLKAAESKAAEHYDAWLRARAETENVRKRAQEDAEQERKKADALGLEHESSSRSMAQTPCYAPRMRCAAAGMSGTRKSDCGSPSAGA